MHPHQGKIYVSFYPTLSLTKTLSHEVSSRRYCHIPIHCSSKLKFLLHRSDLNSRGFEDYVIIPF